MLIQKAEIQLRKTPKELIEWVHSILSRFQTPEQKKQLRSKVTEEYKVFIEESYPLKLFCEHYFHNKLEQATLTQIVGNQSFDVQVDQHPQFEYIEITQAINGEIEALRIKELNKVGHVSASGPVGKKGRKNQNNLLVQFEDFDEDMEILEEGFIIELIEKSVKKKIKKTYPDNTLLLIVFDDTIEIQVGIDLSYLGEYLTTIIKPMIKPVFSGIALVGLSGKTFFI